MLTHATQPSLDLDIIWNPFHSLPIALTQDVTRLLSAGAVVAVGVSGGKDSTAVALATAAHLATIGHEGPRLLIHADLGRVEWRDSLPACQRLARHLGWELLVVRRGAGDMLDRWQGRWRANVARYAALECVRLILPWSTPDMRFCTSELKTQVIAAALRRRFPGRPILNVTGIRRAESAARRMKPVAFPDARLITRDREALVWNPIIEWKDPQVWHIIDTARLERHQAYRDYGSSRVSCAFCIMSSGVDLTASASCLENHDVYRAMVELEARSSFAFQGNRWLADVAPQLLPDALHQDIARAKSIARERNRLEGAIPRHLLYTKGWPTNVPDETEADLLASIRQDIARMLGIDALYITAPAIRQRYRDLILSNQT